MKKYIFLLALLFTGVLTGYSRQSAYLFGYCTGNRMSEEAIRMAVSPDGYNYYALNRNQPVIDSREISSTGGVRDPHILRFCQRMEFQPCHDSAEIEGPDQLDFQCREYPEEISGSGRPETGMGTANRL